jgi:hypothetical protein
MKKVLLLTLVMAFVASISSFASTSKYKVNETAIDQAFEAGINVVAINSERDIMDITSVKAVNEEKNVWIAVILDFFIGGLAVHRVYLGGTPVLIIGYLLTCGGIFGLVPLIDFFVLILSAGDISKYVDNDAFFMW